MSALVGRESPARLLAGQTLSAAAIDAERREAGIAFNALAFTAGIPERTLRRATSGGRALKPDEARKLRGALARLAGGAPRDDRAPLIQQVVNGYLARCCGFFGIAPADAHAQLRRRGELTRDPAWLAASQARAAALYLANTAGDIAQADLARAIGVSRAAVSIALRGVEDRRDEAAFDVFLSEAQRDVRGEI